jgi:hypothetical protein
MTPVAQQLPLLHIVHEDDILLSQTPNADWYRILRDFDWLRYRTVAAAYYDALYQFNLDASLSATHSNPTEKRDCSLETKAEAEQRLLFERATLNEHAPILYQPEEHTPPPRTVDPLSLSPGVVPRRLAGKQPKCFFALLKAFIGASLMGFAPEPENVFMLLTSNLSFARVCGFIPKGPQDPYWNQHVPSLRKLEQFDQIMTENQLYSCIKWEEVHHNIVSGVINPEENLVGDTTHYFAYSGFETVSYVNEQGEEQKKSQSKVTKSCQCKDRDHCPHAWELADEGAGTIVKSKTKIVWGHKASILGLPTQGIPLDAVAVSDAATHDGQTLFPHIKRLFDKLPLVRDWFSRVLYDSACDDEGLRQLLWKEYNLDLKASLNPRRKKDVTNHLPRGMDRLTAQGELFCDAGLPMEFKGIRFDTETFIYGPPMDESGLCICTSCTNRNVCCPNAKNGRCATVHFDLLPHIDPLDAPMAKRYKAIMTQRPSVERMIKRLKCDLSSDCLTKRGNASFQAYLDKTMIAFHILLRQ